MWKNILERGRPQMSLWLMRIAYWTPKATNTHSEYITFIAFPPKLWLHERASISRYTYAACLALYTVQFHGLYKHSNNVKWGG
jgi:hypothetical protein